MARRHGVIGVVGLGSVGEALLWLLHDAGYPTVGVDREPDVLARVEQRMTARAGRRPSGVRGYTLTNDTALLARSDLVIEAVDEDLVTKLDVLRRLHSVCPNETVLVTTTASMALPRLAIASGRPDRTGGLRLFRPPAVGSGVVPVFTSMSRDDTREAVARLVAELGLAVAPVAFHAGLSATDLVYTSLNRAAAAVEEGVASTDVVEAAMRRGCGLPVGPLRLLDELGLDTVHTRLSELWTRSRGGVFRPARLLSSMVLGGALGRKSGEGFYRYDDAGRALGCGAAARTDCPDLSEAVVNRLLYPYLADAVRLLDRPGTDAAEIDAAVERGFGWPTGPFELLDRIGLDVALARLRRLHAEFPESACEPPAAIQQLVAGGFLGRRSGQGFRRV
ncbi:3-hydroxyacyl-CoA dehydrogenase [Streptomyces sp. OF3]|uniref:3-hydroxyacyl-CoA dehydrogenase n=1 Tax=Streptomyces alkaliterrae TaxID=2213162 RepID=A0A7W3WIB7_9ACTN|nr:3-hydroxyacyl-CoA dehydrogenase [Streptomyces alkaliterrae]MBB1252405.1 3-hydroxyacyl-CoA dehydrogenase [Streptomyces alkaliterrae]